MALRFDSAPLSKVQRTPQGGIRCDATLTRTGIFDYKNPDGTTRREYRPDEEVFKQDSISTFEGAPVTIGHPGLVTADNWQQHAVGHVTSARQDAGLVAATVTVQRADAVKAIESKKLGELSVGYNVDLDPTPGEFNGQRYDAVQRNIRANHVALIAPGTGRAGPEARLRLDSKGDEVNDYTKDSMTLEEQLAASKAENEKLKAERTDSKVVEKLTAENQMLVAKVKELEVKVADTSRLDSLVAERVELEQTARKIVGKTFEFKGKSARDIKVAVVTAKNPAMRLDGKSDDYVDAAYGMALTLDTPHPSMAQVRADSLPVVKMDGIAAAEARNREASQNAWKGAKS